MPLAGGFEPAALFYHASGSGKAKKQRQAADIRK